MKWKEKRVFMYWLKDELCGRRDIDQDYYRRLIGYDEFFFSNDVVKIKIRWHPCVDEDDKEILIIMFTYLNEHHEISYYEGLSLTENPINEFWEKYDETFFKLMLS